MQQTQRNLSYFRPKQTNKNLSFGLRTLHFFLVIGIILLFIFPMDDSLLAYSNYSIQQKPNINATVNSICSIPSFNTPNSFSLPSDASFPIAIAVGDFNGDSKLDFVTTNRNSSNLSVGLGNGNGSLISFSSIHLPNGNFSNSIAVGDFNADNKLDFVTVNDGSQSLIVILGNGSGLFQLFLCPQDL
ncbi:MAG: VCBS repeat-containing protein [Acidobacteria bacterium]|nr:VCBS repeat-containing protein [Acidobacteriota bacterium]